MELWILMSHQDEDEFDQGRGYLLGGIYTDIESVCRALNDEVMYKDEIVRIDYQNDGEKAGIFTKRGQVFGAFKSRVPMREDVPTKW